MLLFASIFNATTIQKDTCSILISLHEIADSLIPQACVANETSSSTSSSTNNNKSSNSNQLIVNKSSVGKGPTVAPLNERINTLILSDNKVTSMAKFECYLDATSNSNLLL